MSINQEALVESVVDKTERYYMEAMKLLRRQNVSHLGDTIHTISAMLVQSMVQVEMVELQINGDKYYQKPVFANDVTLLQGHVVLNKPATAEESSATVKEEEPATDAKAKSAAKKVQAVIEEPAGLVPKSGK